jgi:vacuolar-type H+-ATPase subunit H
MDFSDMFNVLYYREVKEENSQKQIEKVIDLVNVNFKEIIESSFRRGFEEGEKYGRNDENVTVRGKIIGKLLSNTTMTDEEIFKIIGLGEEKWKKHITYLRNKYEEGVREGKLKGLLENANILITKKFGELPKEVEDMLKTLDYSRLKNIIEHINDSETLEELIGKLKGKEG